MGSVPGNGALVSLDVNADGYDDLAVDSNRTVSLYLGGAVLGGATWTRNTAARPELATGDVNGDGYADLVVSDPADYDYLGYDDRVQVFLGGPLGLDASATRTWSGSNLGPGVAVSDIDGDGFGDVAIGAPLGGCCMWDGQVKIYRGRAGGVASGGPGTFVHRPGTTPSATA